MIRISVVLLVLTTIISAWGEILYTGEIYDANSGTDDILQGTGFGSTRRVYLLPYITLVDSVIIGFEVYFESGEEMKMQLWREHSQRAGDYWLVYERSITPSAPETTMVIDLPSDEGWKVRSTDRIGFQSSGVNPVLLTRRIPGLGRYLYAAIGQNDGGAIRSFNNGPWQWEWNFKVKMDTDVTSEMYDSITMPVQPTHPTTTRPLTSSTTEQPTTTRTTASSTSSADGNSGVNATPQVGEELSVLLRWEVILAVLIWCVVLTISCFIICCCLLSRRTSEKKRKFYIDYLRRQNPYVDTLRSKDYSWEEFAASNPEEQKSDVGIVNSMMANESETAQK